MTDEALRMPVRRLAITLGDAYRQASVEGVDVLQVVTLLEPVRAAAVAKDPFASWRRLDAAAGQAVGTPAAPIVARARASYIEDLAEEVRGAVTATGGRALWLRTYARALAVFRIPLLSRMVEAPPPGAAEDEVVALLCKATPDIVAGQWDKVMPAVMALLEDAAVDTLDRARLLVIAAEFAMYWHDDTAAGSGYLDRARQIAPDDARVWDGCGTLALKEGDVDAAIRAHRRVVELNPSMENGYIGLGLCAAERDDLSAAEAEYLRGIKECPDGAEIRLSLIQLYGRRSMYAEHEKVLPRLADEILAIDPQSEYDVEVSLGNAYRDNEQVEVARLHYERAAALWPNRWPAHEERGHLELAAGNLDEAEQLFAEVVRVAPGRWNGPYGAALVFLERGMPEDALRELRRCMPSPSVAVRSFFRARIAETLLDLDRIDSAAEEIGEGLADDPTSADLRQVLRQTASRMWTERQAEARTLLDQFRRDATDDAVHAALLGEVASDAGDNAAAVESYREAVRLAPENADYARSLAVVLTTARDWDEARAAIEAGFRADQDRTMRDSALAVLENQRGHALYEAERFDEAAEAYELAAALVPDEAVYRSNVALAHEARTDPGRRLEALGAAVAALKVAVTLTDDPHYARRLRRLRSTALAVSRFGETILTTGTVHPLGVAVAADLVPGVDPRRDGSDFMYQEIPALRERVRGAVGVFIPGIRFREGALTPGGFQLEVYGISVERQTVTGVAELLQGLEAALRRHAWRLLRTDELDRMISEATAGDSRRVPARARLGVGLILRALLRDGIPLTDLPAIIRAIRPTKLKTDDVPAALERARRAALQSLPEALVRLEDPTDAPSERPSGWTRPLAPAQENALAATVRALPSGDSPVFVTDHDRAYRQRLAAAELPGRTVLVLSPDEVRAAGARS